MKKALLILTLLYIPSLQLLGNPVKLPVVGFSELLFDSNNNWTMELTTSGEVQIDSVVLSASEGIATLIANLSHARGLYVITKDSLIRPVNIDRKGDFIKLTTYYKMYNGDTDTTDDSLKFGSFVGASVGSPAVGSSICRFGFKSYRNYYTLDCLSGKTSLGSENNPEDYRALLKGKIYNSKGNPISGGRMIGTSDQSYFELMTPLEIFPDGAYSTYVFPRFSEEKITSLGVRIVDFNIWRASSAVEEFTLNDVQAGTEIVQDIRLKDDEYAVTAVEKNNSEIPDEFSLINYPNPFNPSTNFVVRIPSDIKETSGFLNIYNINGQLIRSFQVNRNCTITWDGKDDLGCVVSSGVYLYNLDIKKQTVKTGRMILLK